MQLNLKLRNLTMKDFIRVMRERKTSGMDLTLLSLCEMLHISDTGSVQGHGVEKSRPEYQ